MRDDVRGGTLWPPGLGRGETYDCRGEGFPLPSFPLFSWMLAYPTVPCSFHAPPIRPPGSCSALCAAAALQSSWFVTRAAAVLSQILQSGVADPRSCLSIGRDEHARD